MNLRLHAFVFPFTFFNLSKNFSIQYNIIYKLKKKSQNQLSIEKKFD